MTKAELSFLVCVCSKNCTLQTGVVNVHFATINVCFKPHFEMFVAANLAFTLAGCPAQDLVAGMTLVITACNERSSVHFALSCLKLSVKSHYYYYY